MWTMKKQETTFKVAMSLSVVSDDEGFYFVNPSSGNIERIIREGISKYNKDMEIKKIQVFESTVI